MAYTVRPGENLTRIARSLGTTVDELVRLNGITNPGLIFPDQVLQTPETGPAAAAPQAPAAAQAAPAPGKPGAATMPESSQVNGPAAAPKPTNITEPPPRRPAARPEAPTPASVMADVGLEGMPGNGLGVSTRMGTGDSVNRQPLGPVPPAPPPASPGIVGTPPQGVTEGFAGPRPWGTEAPPMQRFDAPAEAMPGPAAGQDYGAMTYDQLMQIDPRSLGPEEHARYTEAFYAAFRNQQGAPSPVGAVMGAMGAEAGPGGRPNNKQAASEQKPSSFAPMREMLDTYGRERWPTNDPPHEAGQSLARAHGPGYAQRISNGTLDRVQELERLQQEYGPPPDEAQSYQQQMDYYRQVISSGYRSGGGMRQGAR